MIRKMEIEDIDDVVDIWLISNIKTHHYISRTYWEKQKELVKEMMLEAEVYVYEDEKIKGFVGLSDTYLAGIFVLEQHQSQGIGKKLLDYVKARNEELTLNVYQKNNKAILFYERESFTIVSEEMDVVNQEKEYLMYWHK